MEDNQPMNQSISLSDLQLGIKESINQRYNDGIWVHAEIGTLNVNSSGHCFLELVEKEGLNFKAKIRATIWAFTFRMLKPYFESATGLEFSAGIKVSFKALVEYHEVYGISLNIKDINPEYTVGDIELQRQKIIRKLEEEGIMDMNSELGLSIVPQRIAVISSKTAAGFEDWVRHLTHNEYGYRFSFDLYEAAMQGESTTATVIRALDQIYEKEQQYDAVVLIRGGGSKLDLMSFDTYELAVNIAQFPLPIICGIGHERDQSIADLVSHTSVKTPTAVADFLIDRVRAFEERMESVAFEIFDSAKNLLVEEAFKLNVLKQSFAEETRSVLAQMNKKVLRLSVQIQHQAIRNYNYIQQWIQAYPNKLDKALLVFFVQESRKIRNKQDEMTQLAQNQIKEARLKLQNRLRLIDAHDPIHILNRGFTIVKQEGHYVKSVKQFDAKKSTEIIFKDGREVF